MNLRLVMRRFRRIFVFCLFLSSRRSLMNCRRSVSSVR